MTPQLSSRVMRLPVSSVRSLMQYAQEAQKAGVKIYRLNMGEPDIASPQQLLDALQTFTINPIRYAPSGGTKEYIDALLAYYQRLGFGYLRPQDIIGTTAGSESITMALFSTLDPGDGVLVFEPFYSAYATACEMGGVELQAVRTTLENGFHLPDDVLIEKAIKANTKAILFANPNNPTGTVFTRDEVSRLVALAKKHDLFLISDEVYREYVFVDRPAVSILEYMQEIPEQAILVDSLSKRYSICGARLGALVSLNEGLMKGVFKIAMSRLSGGLIDQYLGAHIMAVPPEYTDAMKTEFEKRRDLSYRLLSSIPGVELALPEGAFYIFAKLPVSDAQEFCTWLLKTYRNKNETVFLAPGCGFYKDPKDGISYVRIAYVLEETQLTRALELLKDALQQYKLIKN